MNSKGDGFGDKQITVSFKSKKESLIKPNTELKNLNLRNNLNSLVVMILHKDSGTWMWKRRQEQSEGLNFNEKKCRELIHKNLDGFNGKMIDASRK